MLRIAGAEKVSYAYRNDTLTHIVCQVPGEEGWVNYFRMVLMYTPYSESKIRSRAFPGASANINADINVSHGARVLSLKVDNPSGLRITLTDISGRIVQKIADRMFSSGSHSIPLNIGAPGKYFCNIVSKGARTVVPLTVTR